MRPTTNRAPVYAALAVGVTAISAAALGIRLSHAPSLAIAFHRLAYATLLLAPWSVGPARRGWRTLTRTGRAQLVAAGALLGLHFATWIASLAPSSPYATSVAASATLVASHPALVALATPWVTGRAAPRGAWAGIALSLVGAAVIAWGDSAHGTHRLAGDGLALLGAACAAGYFVLGARLRATLDLRAYLFPVYGVAAAVAGVLWWLSGTAHWIASWREQSVFVALAVGPMLLGHGALNWSLRHAPAWLVSAAVLAEPAVSSLLVLCVMGERPPWTAALGAAVVIAGLAALMRAEAPVTGRDDAGALSG